MTSLSVTNSFSSLEEQGRELFYPLSLGYEDYYRSSKNLQKQKQALISMLFSMMKIVYRGFNAASYSDPFETSQGHKMKKKMLEKMPDVANSLVHCLFRVMR